MTKRWRTKEAAEIARAVTRVGGHIDTTAKGHLKISGPAGTAIVASAPSNTRTGGRAMANTLATIAAKTGLNL